MPSAFAKSLSFLELFCAMLKNLAQNNFGGNSMNKLFFRSSLFLPIVTHPKEHQITTKSEFVTVPTQPTRTAKGCA